MKYEYRIATSDDLEKIWQKNIKDNSGDNRWLIWKDEYIKNNEIGKCKTFIISYNNKPIGEGTLLFSPDCGAINGRNELADGKNIANINALRIEKVYEGMGHISKIIKNMERYSVSLGFKVLTIGVEASETRNLAIYLHWDFNNFIMSEINDGALVLYYSKKLTIL